MRPIRIKEIWNNTVVSLASLLVFFVATEWGLRGIYAIRASMIEQIALPYMLGDLYGPLPPWWDNLRILEPDEGLIWKGRPNVQRTYMDVFSPIQTEQERRALLRSFSPSLPASLRNNPIWQISLNSEGFRDQELVEHKPPLAFRIFCLGDSWTFGSNVGQDQTYPRQLQRLLRQDFPHATFQVLNLSVMGYSSFQGLELLRRRALKLNPDLLVIGFAMNDSSIAGFRDKDMPGYGKTMRWTKALGSFLEKNSETYKLLRYLAHTITERPKTMTDILQGMAASTADGSEVLGRRMMEPSEYAKYEPWTRVSLVDYEQNLRAMIELAQSRGIGVTLLYNELWESSPYRAALEKVAQATSVHLIDSSALLAEARRAIERRLDRELGLEPAVRPPMSGDGMASRRPIEKNRDTRGEMEGHDVEVVFRVYSGHRPVPQGFFIAGAHSKLGDAVPNVIRMYDDGTHGDQQAGDHVWSYAATFSPGTSVFYVYTNSGREGAWEGLDVPHVRGFKVDAADAGKTIYRPIETFGEIYLQADSWHTNAMGYELIAQAVLQNLKRDEKGKAYLERFKVERPDAAMSASKAVPGHRL